MQERFGVLYLAVGGALCLSGSLGLWEFAFSYAMTLFAYAELSGCRGITMGRSLWSFLHRHRKPITKIEPGSSFGCTTCDPVLALRNAMGAPTAWAVAGRSHPQQTCPASCTICRGGGAAALPGLNAVPFSATQLRD
ncbi:DUF6010 family protein [Sphingomonas sp. 3-13AW]|uniref:DUF6010 family protein n=1 Tax=Sphingomonas sp. 3-13AW TaxID=3050450 RepID=UPI003BB5A9FD